MDNVFAVTSGKGGVGKTTTAINLAVAIGREDRPVVVVDADLGMSDVGTFLDLDPAHTLHDVLSGDASIESALSEIAPGVDALVGSRDLGRFPDADPDELGSVIEQLAEQYAFVFIDTGGGLSYEAVVPLESADAVVLVTSPQPAAIDNTKRSKQLADRVGVSVSGVVVTHSNERTDAAAIADEIGVSLLGSVSADPIIPESTERCQSLFEYAPDSEATEAYRRIGAALVEETEDSEADQEPRDGEESSESDSSVESDEVADGDAVDELEGGDKPADDDEPADDDKPSDDGEIEISDDVDEVEPPAEDDSPAEPGESDESEGSAADTPEETDETAEQPTDTESASDQDTESTETKRSGGVFSRLFGWLR